MANRACILSELMERAALFPEVSQTPSSLLRGILAKAKKDTWMSLSFENGWTSVDICVPDQN